LHLLSGDRVGYAKKAHWIKTGNDVECIYCGRHIPFGKRHIDHVIPLAMNGLDSTDNIEPACAACNNEKKAKHPLIFLAHKAETWLEEYVTRPVIVEAVVAPVVLAGPALAMVDPDLELVL